MLPKPPRRCFPAWNLKSGATDPVRIYMREMGTVELLTREGEIDIAKRIEDGINQVQCSVAEYPEAITYLLEQYDRVEAEEARLSDLITGFVDPNAEEDLAPTATHVGSELPRKIWTMTKMKTKKMVTTIPPMMTTASTRNWLAKNLRNCALSTL